ncbi:MAG: metal-dependent hydrolase [Sphaerobacter sp.]|nr:metal-dependent hydrolase [Sphaerobacter sp.]
MANRTAPWREVHPSKPAPPERAAPPLRWDVPLSLVATALGAALTAACHRRWAHAGPGSSQRALFDGACHVGTALAVASPVSPYVRDPGAFLRVAVASALLIDLDHVVAARSLRLTRWMTMPARPPSHSLLAPLLLATLAERLAPERHLGLAAVLGLGSHLLRDLYTGGVPLLHPRRVISLSPNVVIPVLALLALSSRSGARRRLGTRLRRLLYR